MTLVLWYIMKMSKSKITYSQVGDDYSTKDPVKKLAQTAAASTGNNLKNGFSEVSDTRGESAYVWKQGDIYMASVIEGLGTKNLVADELRDGYDVIGHDTVATIINDLVTVGAKPLVIHAYWAIEDNSWLQDSKRMQDLIQGWKSACDLAGVSWGGGETPTLKGIISPNTIDLGGCAIGIITSEKRLILDLLDSDINIHYISNITGHGLRKIMRSSRNFTYVIEKLFEPQEVFKFIQKEADLNDYEMYETFNMGQDYAIFLSAEDVEKAQNIISQNGFESLDGGFVEEGERKIVIKPKNIIFEGSTLDLR